MPPSRRPPYVRWKVNLDATLAARIELLFFDPIHGKPRYAERSQLIETLLREWLDRTHPESSGLPPSPSGPRTIERQPPTGEGRAQDIPLSERSRV